MTDKKKLTPREAYALLTKFVEEKGADYVYAAPNEESEACLYVYNGAPSCLVGHVLVAAGVPFEEIKEVEETSAHTAVPRLLDVSVDLADALDAAQKKQDGGRPWGEALKAFEDALEVTGVEYK